MSKPLHIILAAVEPSGDALGAALASALRSLRPDVTLTGLGGAEMRAAGIDSLVDIEPLSVMGPVDALRAAPAASHAASMLGQHAHETGADAAVFIDSWAFSRMAAGRMRQMAPGVKRYKYVAPQVWASRPSRTFEVAALFDGLITLFSFEPALFREAGARAVFAGHPGFQRMADQRHRGGAFHNRHALGRAPVLLLAPGSRRSEIAHLAAPFREAADMVRRKVDGLKIAIPVAHGREAEVRAAFADWDAEPIFVDPADKGGAFDAASVGLVASGTVSTELAICRTPMAVGYKAGPLTAFWAKRVVTSKYASLVNIALDREVIPEFIQERCISHNLAAAVLELFKNEKARKAQLDAFPAALSKLGADGHDGAHLAARTLLDWIEG